MSDLSAAAAALGVPEAIVKRSAEARAKATGASVDEILAAWAGGAPMERSEPTPSEPASPPPVESLPAASPEPTPAAEAGVGETGTEPRVAEPAAAVVAAPAPTEVGPKEALRYPAVVTVPSAGLLERTIGTIPRWLSAAFLILPLFGLLQLASASNLQCGEGTVLAVDRVTGIVENCDGTPFEGRGTPGGGADFVALGGQIFAGQVVPAANCAGCHGAQGQGGTGPPLSGVATTFGSCLDHIEWVTKGSSGFQAEGRTTFGDLGKPITANMPSFAASLSAEQIAAVAAFERVRFAGAAPEETLADCGLAEAPAEEEGAEGETTETTTAETTTAP